MSGAGSAAPDRTAAAFEEAGLDPTGFALLPKPGPPTPLRTHLGEDTVLTVAVDDDGRRQNLLEAGARRWAAEIGVRCPEVLGVSPRGDWLLARRVRSVAPGGSAYVEAALDSADRIAAASPPQLALPATRWRAGLRARVLPALRGALGGLDVRRFLHYRRAAAALPDRTTCHGDFYRRNVLLGGDGGVSVVDWEFVGSAPRWTDHLRIWSTLRRVDDRRQAWDRITAGLDPGSLEHVHLLAGWLCHRLLAENLAAPPDERDEADLAHARRVVVETLALTGASRPAR